MKTKSGKKVAFIATVYRHLEAFHLPYIQLLQEKGYEVHAYGAPDHGKDGILNNNVICHDMKFKRNPFHPNNLKVLQELVKSFKKENFQLVHFHTPIAGILGRIAAKQAKVPHVLYTAHGFHFFTGAPISYWLIYFPMEKIMAKWTDYLITINQEDFNRANKFKVRRATHYIAGIGVETNKFTLKNEIEVRKEKRMELQLKENEFVILCVAELNGNKNQRQLIESIYKIKEKYENVKCLLVGTGEDAQSLQEFIDQLKLKENVHLLGFRRDIPELLAASDVVTLLSKREGLPKALLEALAASKPVVATNVRGNRDLVVDGHNGYLVPISDVESTVNAFVKILDNPIRMKKMGTVSKEIVKKYDLGEILSEMEFIYNKALEFNEKNVKKKTI
ncbi:hypothetical protein A3863_24385 [Priestia endophytica]|nr:hypothetical protein A3863_24385 [Priestia endophytica]